MTGALDLIAWPLTGGKVIDERLDVDADAPVFSAEAFELAFEGFSIVNRHLRDACHVVCIRPKTCHTVLHSQ